MQIGQLFDAVIVADDGALVAPLAAQHGPEQPRIGVRGNAVDLVVGRHQGTHIRAAHRLFERRKEVFAQRAFGNLRRPDIGAAFGLSVPGKVLERGEHLSVGERKRIALIALDRGNTHLADQIRVFAERLLDATPARIARDVDDRRQDHAHAARTDLASDDAVDLPDQIGVPGAGERDRLRKVRGILGGIAVQAFLMEEHRNAKTRIVDGPALDGIHEVDRFLYTAQRGNAGRDRPLAIRRPRELADAVGKFRPGLGFVELQIAVENRGLVDPDAEHLGHFLLQRHALEQIFDARGDRSRSVLVNRRCCVRGLARCTAGLRRRTPNTMR